MRRIALFLLPLLVLACSKEKEQASTRLVIKYTPGFEKGCFTVEAQDEVNESLVETKGIMAKPTQLEEGVPYLTAVVVQKDGWSKKFKVRVTAHELPCSIEAGRVTGSGKQAVTVERSFEFAAEGVKDETASPLVLNTVDNDRDGYIAIANGGTDCQDSGTNAAARFPGNAEVCDLIDNNCNDTVDEGLDKDWYLDADRDGIPRGPDFVTNCKAPSELHIEYSAAGPFDCKDSGPDADKVAPNKTEVCDGIDNNCDDVVDENFDKNWYQDEDGDGVPRVGVTVQCDSPGPKFKHYLAGPPYDCNDGDADNTPGKTELCDNKDNNCDGNTDETFAAKGNACNNSSCTGTFVCNIPQNVLECSARAPRMFYPDLDQDGDGDKDATVDEVCEGENPQSGHVENLHGDCDDVDPASRAGRAEVCDGIDNDCNGQVDDGLDCGTLKQVPSYHVRFESDDHDWLTVATHSSGYPVWIAGRNGKLAVRKSAAAKFESFSFGDATTAPPDGSPAANTNNCGDKDWLASWVDSTGVVYLAGETGTVAFHDGTAGFPCAVGGAPAADNITAMVGFERNGSKFIYLTDTGGRLFRWVVGGAVTELDDHNVNYYGVHGVREEALLVVGGASGGSSPGQRFFSYAVVPGGAATRSSSHTYTPGNVSGNARAVWMGTETTACAVGDNGSVWRWNGTTTWNKVSVPGAPTEPFNSVVMRNDGVTSPQRFLAGHCYMVDGSANGRLRRLTPYGWAKGPAFQANVPLNDIAITATGDIWIVGENGRVFHYPEPM